MSNYDYKQNENGCCCTGNCCDEPDIDRPEHECPPSDPNCGADVHWCLECSNCGKYCNCDV